MVVAAAGAGWRAMARRLQVMKRNPEGYPVGMIADADNIANNTIMSAHSIPSLRTLTHPQKTVASAFDKGDNKVRGKMYIGVDDNGEGSFEVGVEDEVFDASNQRTPVDVNIASDMAVIADNNSEVETPPWMLMGATRKLMDDGTYWFDNDIYLNVLINKSTKPGIKQDGGESPNPTIYGFVPTEADRLITGHLFEDTDLTVLENTDTFIKIRSKYPLSVTAFKGNGSATAVQLPYLPFYSGATGAAQNIVTKNGATIAVTSISTTTGIVTLAAAGSAGDMFIIVYQTRFRPAV